MYKSIYHVIIIIYSIVTRNVWLIWEISKPLVITGDPLGNIGKQNCRLFIWLVAGLLKFPEICIIHFVTGFCRVPSGSPFYHISIGLVEN